MTAPPPEPETDLARLVRERDVYRQLLGLAAVDDVRALLDDALEVAVDAARADRGYLAVFAGRPDPSVTPRYATALGAGSTDPADFLGKISRGIVAEALRTGEPVHTPHAVLDPRFSVRDSIREMQVGSVLCVPFGEPFRAVLYLQGRPMVPFAPLDVELVTQVTQHLAPIVDRALAQAQRDQEDPTARLRRGGRFSLLAGRSAALAQVLRLATDYAQTRATVLITGPTGSGKTELARELHRLSKRADGPWVELNCAAIPESLFEAELFGAAGGAYTGRDADHVGHLERAEGGTLLLDEVAELPLKMQPKLLQLIQDRVYRRLGDSEERTADVRIVAATNRDLDEEVKRGRFRLDLYHRLDVLRIRMPSMEERREDLPDLVDALGQRLAERHEVPWAGVPSTTMLLLQLRAWEGNVRELSNMLERGIVIANGRPIDERILFDERDTTDDTTTDVVPLDRATLGFQQRYARQVDAAVGHNRTAAARLLKISRSFLYKLLGTEHDTDHDTDHDDAR